MFGNAVFAGGTAVSVTSAGGSAADNVADGRVNAPGYLGDPLAAIPSLSLYPKAAMLKKTVLDMSGASAFPDWNRDFNGAAFDSTFRGAYSGEGRNPGWTLAIAQKPAV